MQRAYLDMCGEIAMHQYLTLDEWAEDRYRSNPPGINTLRRYAKNGYFYPPARKEGRLWRVREDADLVWEKSQPVIKPNDDPRLMRILTDGSST